MHLYGTNMVKMYTNRVISLRFGLRAGLNYLFNANMLQEPLLGDK